MTIQLLLRLVPASILLAVIACGFDPAGDSPMDPPAVYREWWAKTQACSGLVGDFDRVRWQVLPGHSFSCASGKCAGHWEPSHEIFLAADWTESEMVVRHEMLHDLIERGGHPNPPFGVGCPLTWSTWSGSVVRLASDSSSLEID